MFITLLLAVPSALAYGGAATVAAHIGLALRDTTRMQRALEAAKKAPDLEAILPGAGATRLAREEAAAMACGGTLMHIELDANSPRLWLTVGENDRLAQLAKTKADEAELLALLGYVLRQQPVRTPGLAA